LQLETEKSPAEPTAHLDMSDGLTEQHKKTGANVNCSVGLLVRI